MRKNTIEIIIHTSKKTGILPILMQKISLFDLIYRRCINVYEKDGSYKLNVICMGDLGSDEEELIAAIKEIPEVESVESVSESGPASTEYSGSSDTYNKFHDDLSNFTMLRPLRASDEITHDILQIVEDRLSKIFGPAANVLLRSAAKKTELVGELFLILANELDEKQKEEFLLNVEGLKVMETNKLQAQKMQAH